MAKRKKKKSRSPTIILILILIIAILSLAIWLMSEALDESREELKKLSLKTRPSETTSQKAKLSRELSAKQKTALKNIVGNPDINKLISQKPTFGGSWGIWSEENVTFVDDRTALIVYEDGHVMGAMIVKISDPSDIGTWKVLWNGIL